MLLDWPVSEKPANPKTPNSFGEETPCLSQCKIKKFQMTENKDEFMKTPLTQVGTRIPIAQITINGLIKNCLYW